MKKYNIAFAGTFDVENYGDLMFPVVFECAMKKRGLDFKLTLFSPSEKAPEALDDSKIVYSFRDFDDLNKKYHFDALVVGGGALIHFRDFDIFLPNQKKRSVYHNIHSWLSLIYLASKNNIKILFNLPQVPFEIPEELQDLAKAAFSQVDYLSVRDDFSKQNIEKIYKKSESKPIIKVFPDTVCVVNELFDEDELLKIKNKILEPNSKYMVFHFQFADKISEEVFNDLKKIADDAINRGLKVVLLPIGYTHGDMTTMEDFNRRYDKKCIVFNRKLDVIEMTAILANCEYYVGMSFHGSVVSIAFDKKAFSTNKSLKNIELYKSYGLSEFLLDNYDEVLLSIREVEIKDNIYKYDKTQISELVNNHLDNIYSFITKKNKKNKNYIDLENQLFLALPKLELCSRELARQNSIISENENLKRNIIIKNNEVEKKNMELYLIRKSFAFKIGSAITYIPHQIKKLIKNRKKM